jgi:hypothetical protein
MRLSNRSISVLDRHDEYRATTTIPRPPWQRACSSDSFRTLYFTDDDLMSQDKPSSEKSKAYLDRRYPRRLYILRLSPDMKTRFCKDVENQRDCDLTMTGTLSARFSTVDEVNDERIWELVNDIEFGARRNRFCRDAMVCTVECVMSDRPSDSQPSLWSSTYDTRPGSRWSKLKEFLKLRGQWRKRARDGDAKASKTGHTRRRVPIVSLH